MPPAVLSPTSCMSGRTQSEHGPAGRLEPPVGVISVPIPCSLGCHCDGEMPPEGAEGAQPEAAPHRPVTLRNTVGPQALRPPIPPPPLPTTCMSGWTQSEKGPAGRLEPPVEVISIPIPWGIDCHCDGERTGRRPVVGGSRERPVIPLASRWPHPPHPLRLWLRNFPHQGGRTPRPSYTIFAPSLKGRWGRFGSDRMMRPESRYQPGSGPDPGTQVCPAEASGEIGRNALTAITCPSSPRAITLQHEPAAITGPDHPGGRSNGNPPR